MIAIVGGGCSGVLVAAHLLERHRHADVMIAEPRAELGRGLAYSTPWHEHLLNVPASQMSAFASKPSHFVEWLARQGWPGGGAFLPRNVYGGYLQDTLAGAIAKTAGRGRLTHVRSEVMDLDVTSLGVVLTMSDASVQRASSAVLALGNPSPAAIAGMAPATPDPRVFASAWDAEALRLRSPDERVLLIGSGLTAMDALLAFESQGHTGPLHMVSRRGRLPQAHRGQPPAVVAPSAEPPAALRDVYRKSRERIRDASDWREVVDGLRPVTNDLWHAWSLRDRARFLRHVKVHWDGHRHRMAPEIGATLARCRQRGRFFVHAGRLRSLLPSKSGLHVELVTRAQEAVALEVDRVINCTGIAERYARSRRPLIAALLSKQLARPNEMGTGFSVSADGALVDGQGRASDRLFTLGPPRYGELLETIAVPEIRVQAERLAERLGESFVPPEPVELANHESD